MGTSLGSADPDSEPNLQSRLKARIRGEWISSTVALLSLTFCLSYFSDTLGLRNLNNTLYDQLTSALVHYRASEDILIVAIDDSSIEELGYWPWRRVQHARLLEQLSEARAVALDLVLSEYNPAYPEDDAVLARAIQNHGRVVLPLVVNHDQQNLTLPLPILRDAAARLGYINIYPDADGVIRSFTAQKRLASGQILNHLSLELLDAGHHTEAAQRLREYRSSPLRIAYTRFSHDLAVIPYSRVLDGSIPPSVFAGKYVLVGSWGTGLGDTFATPYSNRGDAMSGVEVLANLLNGGLEDQWIKTPNRLTMALLCLIPVLLSCLAFRQLSPQRSFLFTVILFISTLVIVGLFLHYGLWWLSPSAALAGTILAYPVWSWRSQHAALHHIDDELDLLHKERLIPHTTETRATTTRHLRSLLPHDQSLLARIRQLHAAIDGVRAAQQQRNETLRFLSHDMRAPLNSILALTELQRSSNPGSETTHPEVLAQFDHYANKTLALVDGFVALGRAEAAELDQRPTNLAELIIQCCDDAWIQAQKKQIRIVTDKLPEDAWVQADATLLERAWANLLDNALKYSPNDTTITCSIERDGDEWLVRIQDQGRGIDTHKLTVAFSPFVRIDEHNPDNPAGVGLGLAFVRTVIARHGGDIHVESQPNKGTCFTIRLKALDQDSGTDEPEPASNSL